MRDRTCSLRPAAKTSEEGEERREKEEVENAKAEVENAKAEVNDAKAKMKDAKAKMEEAEAGSAKDEAKMVWNVAVDSLVAEKARLERLEARLEILEDWARNRQVALDTVRGATPRSLFRVRLRFCMLLFAFRIDGGE